MTHERGGITAGMLWTIVAVLVFFGLIGVACGACFNGDDNDHSLGACTIPVPFHCDPKPHTLAYHHRDGGRRGDGGDNGNDNDQRRCHGSTGDCRGSFSPGPFDRSPVDIHDNCISLNCAGYSPSSTTTTTGGPQ